MPRAPYSQAPAPLRRAPPAQVRAPHHVRSLQVPKGTACRWRCGRCGRADILLQAPPWAGGSTGESTRWRSGRAPSLRTPLALYASRQGLPEVLAFFWHPHHIARHPRVHRQFALLAAVCRCILVLEDQLACSTSTRLVVAVHRAAASLSTPPSECVGVWPACDNSGLWWRSFKEFAPASPASNATPPEGRC